MAREKSQLQQAAGRRSCARAESSARVELGRLYRVPHPPTAGLVRLQGCHRAYCVLDVRARKYCVVSMCVMVHG